MVSSTILLLIGVLATILAAWFYVLVKVRREQPRSRPVVRVRHLIGPAVFILGVLAIMLTLIGTVSFSLTYVVTANPDATSETITLDEPATRTIELPVEPLPGLTYIVRGQRVKVEEWMQTGSTMEVTVSIPPPPETGEYSSTLTVTPYPALLPRNVLESLHDIHSTVAMAASAIAAALPPYVVASLLLDGERPLFRTRRRWLWRRLGDRR